MFPFLYSFCSIRKPSLASQSCQSIRKWRWTITVHCVCAMIAVTAEAVLCIIGITEEEVISTPHCATHINCFYLRWIVTVTERGMYNITMSRCLLSVASWRLLQCPRRWGVIMIITLVRCSTLPGRVWHHSSSGLVTQPHSDTAVNGHWQSWHIFLNQPI